MVTLGYSFSRDCIFGQGGGDDRDIGFGGVLAFHWSTIERDGIGLAANRRGYQCCQGFGVTIEKSENE
jgi:hypothetical protein